MMKRILSLILCLGMLAGVLLMAGCGDSETSGSTGTLPATINMLGITEESTTPEAVQAVEDALNKITKNRYKTKVNLTLVTADEYIALIEERVAAAEEEKTRLAAIAKYNTLAQKEANNAEKLLASEKKSTSKWTKKVTSVIASTISTGEVYSAEETTVYEDGKIETVYPEAESPIDIVMIAGKEMYDYLDSKGYLLSIARTLETDFTKFKQYIYPTFFDQLSAITGDIKAIPNNNLLAEYTYLVVDKTLADKYDFDVDAVDNYEDLDAAAEGEEGFLTQIKKNEDVIPFATVPDALGIYQYFDGDIPVGTYFDPIYGYSVSEGTDFTIQNLFSIPEYQAHLILMEKYEKNGYFTADSDTEDFAVTVIKGDSSIEKEYGDDYYVKVLQNPFVEIDSIFEGMLAVSSYTSDEKRALQVIEMINTDSEVKNLLQYGIEYDGDNDDIANYRVNTIQNDDGTVSYSITRLNQNYMMNNALTGNVYMGYPEEGQTIDAWTYYKQTNLASALSPFLNFYMSDDDLDDTLNSIIRRAVLSEALEPLEIDYDAYEDSLGTNQGTVLRRSFKQYYKEYFIELLGKEGLSSEPFTFVTKNNMSELEADFLSFVLSAEGQAILKSNGYTPISTEAAPYVKKSTAFSGTLTMCASVKSALYTYFEPTMRELAAAYEELYPDVDVVVPERDRDNVYQVNMSEVANGTYNIGLMSTDISDVYIGLGLTGTLIATDYLEVFNNDSHLTYTVSWYENKMVEEMTAEKYADIVSESGLSLMITNKLGELAGIDLSKYSASSRPASETVVFETARKNADSYYTNITYLRVMAEILLWDELPESELAEYRALKDADFETAVFDYVKANYEKEHNLTDEDYENLVRDFMVSVLEYTSPTDKTTTYTVSWDEFQTTKQNAQIYIKAAETIRDAYYDKLVAKLGSGYLRILTLPDIIDEVYNIMYEEYLESNGLSQTEFEYSIMDKYLSAVGTTGEEFSALSKSSDEYNDYLTKLRKKYKKILVDAYSLDAYKNGESGISNNEVVSTLFDYYKEEEVKIYDQMCSLAGVDYEEFSEAESHMENYSMYLNTLKTMFVYTLRTQYTQTQIDSWSYEEIETNLYNILYETGFYTNEVARYIGLSLSEYMLAKSDAVTYQNYLQTLVSALSDDLSARGYDVSEFAKEDRDVIESVCKDIILEKYFGDKVQFKEVLISASADYMNGLKDAEDVEAYLKEASDALSKNYFFMAVVNALQAGWAESKAAS